MPGGRPTIFSQELADKLCEQLATGDSMRTVCAADDMPSMSSVFKWLRENEEFSKQYARAKAEAADAFVEEILDISDNGVNDWMEKQYGDRKEWVVNGEALQRSKLRVDTRKWIASKLKPKKYGDKLDIESISEITHKFEDLTDEQLEAAIKARQDRTP